MPSVTRVVRFFEPIIIDGQGQHQTISSNFWPLTWTHVDGLPLDERIHRYNNVRFFGHARRLQSPAMPWLYVGRLRPAADHPDGFRPGEGITGPLQPAQAGDEISEPTFIIPFGGRNYVAMMSPTSGATRVQAIERWINLSLGLHLKGQELSLLPLVDRKMLEKLEASPGATRLHVRVAPGVEVPDDMPGQMMKAVHDAVELAPDDLFTELTWSAGRRKGTAASRSDLLVSTRSVWTGGWAEKAEVNLQVEDEDGDVRTEVHRLVNDRIAIKTTFDVPENEPPSEESVLKGMQDAIEQFNKQQT